MKIEIISLVLSCCLILGLHLVQSHPTDFQDPIPHEKTGEASLRSVSDINSKTATATATEIPQNIANPIPPVSYQVSPDSGTIDHGPAEFITFSRQRRSAGKVPSPELQSLFAGNWARQNPESFLRLLNLLTTKEKEAVFSEEEYDDVDQDPEPIDLVYYGKKPYPVSVESAAKPKTVNAEFQQPISLMSSGKARDFVTDDDPIKLHVHRLKKYGYPYGDIVKRSYYRKNMPLGHDLDFYYPLPYQYGKKDFTMLPNGEISLTQQGLHSLRNFVHPTLQVDDGIPIIRRPIL